MNLFKLIRSYFFDEVVFQSKRVMNLLIGKARSLNEILEEGISGLKLCLLQKIVFVQRKKLPNQIINGFTKIIKTGTMPVFISMIEVRRSFSLAHAHGINWKLNVVYHVLRNASG